MGAHNSIRRYLHRIGEEIRSTAEIAKLTSWPAAVETLIAKADIQIMCRNRYAEPPSARRRLIRKHETLLKYFEKRYGDFASGYRYKVNLPAVPEELKGCIWLCWWQGLDHAPRIVQRCVESIREYAGDRRVIVITEDNYRDYVTFPDWMMRKYHEGTIARTHLSDLLRMAGCGWTRRSIALAILKTVLASHCSLSSAPSICMQVWRRDILQITLWDVMPTIVGYLP